MVFIEYQTPHCLAHKNATTSKPFHFARRMNYVTLTRLFQIQYWTQENRIHIWPSCLLVLFQIAYWTLIIPSLVRLFFRYVSLFSKIFEFSLIHTQLMASHRPAKKKSTWMPKPNLFMSIIFWCKFSNVLTSIMAPITIYLYLFRITELWILITWYFVNTKTVENSHRIIHIWISAYT